MRCSVWLVFILMGMFVVQTRAQSLLIKGRVVSDANRALRFVSIGFHPKEFITTTDEAGNFRVKIPANKKVTALYFKHIGFRDTSILISQLKETESNVIYLKERFTDLAEIDVTPKQLQLKKIGVVKYNPTLHFLDGTLNPNETYELAQSFKLPKQNSQLKRLNFFINETQACKTTFRVNFYTDEQSRPAKRLKQSGLLKEIETHAGWNSIDFSGDNIWLNSSVFLSIYQLPNQVARLTYEVKLGGKINTFIRSNAEQAWQEQPHHYRMYAEFLVPKNDYEESDDLELEAMPQYRMYSTFVKDSFCIFVGLPKDYETSNKNYKLKVLLDANAYFDQLNDVEDDILVGIGYRDAFLADSLRNRDLTYPPNKNFSSYNSGGAPDFLNFIQSELLPFIRGKYRTDAVNTCLMGHSLAGYFCLYAMCMQPHLFNRIVAASPSIDQAPIFLQNLFRSLPDSSFKNLELIMSIGEKEKEEQPLFQKSTETLQSKVPKLKTVVFQNHDHMSTALPSFRK